MKIRFKNFYRQLSSHFSPLRICLPNMKKTSFVIEFKYMEFIELRKIWYIMIQMHEVFEELASLGPQIALVRESPSYVHAYPNIQ